jgi:hypothetical protein
MDYLDEDPVLPPCQTVALISVVKAAGDDPRMALKVRGCFDDRETANAHVARLNSRIPEAQQTPMYLVDIGKWLCMPPPSADQIIKGGGEEVYQEAFLQTMMQEYRKNNELAAEHFERRRQDLVVSKVLPEDEDAAADDEAPTENEDAAADDEAPTENEDAADRK